MNLSFLLLSSLLSAFLNASTKANVGGSANSGVKSRMATKELAAAQDRKIQAFIEHVRNDINQIAAVPKPKSSAKAKNKAAAKLAERKAKRQAKIDAKKVAIKAAKKPAAGAVVPSAGKGEAGAMQPLQAEGEEIFSESSSFEGSWRRRSISHFSLSESEHYKDCSDMSSSSTTDDNGVHHRRPRYGYRLRHCRINAQQQRFRTGRESFSGSFSEDEGEVELSGSFSEEHHRRRTGRTVLRICEDELARRDNRHCRRDRSRHRRRRSSSSSSSSDFSRVDYRKKVFYHSDSERSASVSESFSFSVEAEGGAPPP